MFKFLFVCLVSLLSVTYGCKSRTENTKIAEPAHHDSALTPQIKKSSKIHHSQVSEITDSIYNDTIRSFNYKNNIWTDSVITKDYKALFVVQIDTTDFIIDTIKSLKGRRIIIGYNHYYKIFFSKNNKPWFKVSFNKKKDLESLIGGTDYWIASNLDVFHRLVYNEKYQKFIVEFEINPMYNFGSDYYFVFDSHGKIEHTGTAGSWGGNNPDGFPFITDDCSSYITCYEVYNFKNSNSMPLSDFTAHAELKTYGSVSSDYRFIHGLRNLSKNNILVVYNRSDSNPDYNALIINTDTILMNRFKYYGLLEEMSAEFLFKCDSSNKVCYIYDSDREKLISIDEKNPLNIKEFNVSDMIKVKGDTMNSKKYTVISFEVFGNYRFYKTPFDSGFYRDIDKLE